MNDKSLSEDTSKFVKDRAADFFTSPLKIKDWAEGDRPREKLLEKGRQSLSDAELIAILIGSGSASESAVEVGKKVLALADNDLNQLGKLGVEELKSIKGIGEAKAISIVAALELGRRRKNAPKKDRVSIKCSADAYDYLYPYLGDLHYEEVWVLLLSRANHVIKPVKVSSGGFSSAAVDIRFLLLEAIQAKANGIILAHNHPSGETQPSNADIELTKSIKEACKLLDLNFLDHLIIVEKGYYSFADEGAID